MILHPPHPPNQWWDSCLCLKAFKKNNNFDSKPSLAITFNIDPGGAGVFLSMLVFILMAVFVEGPGRFCIFVLLAEQFLFPLLKKTGNCQPFVRDPGLEKTRFHFFVADKLGETKDGMLTIQEFCPFDDRASC